MSQYFNLILVKDKGNTEKKVFVIYWFKDVGILFIYYLYIYNLLFIFYL